MKIYFTIGDSTYFIKTNKPIDFTVLDIKNLYPKINIKIVM